MPIKKHQKLNPNGRPKGATNKTTGEIRQAFQMLVENNLDQLQTDLNSIDPDKRIGFIIKMSEFFLPKMQSMTIENSLELEYKSLEALLLKADDASLEIISNKILTLKNQTNE